MSMREAASRAGFSVTTWSALESGVRKVGGGIEQPANPQVENVIAAAKVVGLDHNVALHLLDPKKYPDPMSAQVSDRRPTMGRPTVTERELARKIQELSPFQRWLVDSVVEQLRRTAPDPNEPRIDVIYRNSDGTTVYAEAKQPGVYYDEGRDPGESRPVGEESSESR